jgi:hypothetical protein
MAQGWRVADDSDTNVIARVNIAESRPASELRQPARID